MKILKTVMLSLLAVTCVVMVTVAVIHFTGSESGGRDADGNNRARSGANGEVDEQEDVDLTVLHAEEERADFRFLHRSASISAESGLWQFFPSIPYFEVLPGETAVLSVSVDGFKGWKVDLAFANVELFDEKTDEENAYVSFIMPDEEVSIAALYADEIPQSNFDSQTKTIMDRRNNREYGDAAIMSSDIVPLPVDPTPIDWQVNSPMNLTIRNPDIVTQLGLDAIWVFPDFYPNSTTIQNLLPTGLTWRSAGIQGGILITGTPTVEGVTNFYFDLHDRATYVAGDPLTYEPSFIGMYEFVFTVWPRQPDPRIITPSVPDAMIGVWYEVTIQTTAFPSNLTPPYSVWELVPDTSRTLPDGLDLWWDDQGDMDRGFIRGTPEDTASTGAAGYSFNIQVRQTNPGSSVGLYTTPVVSYNIRVWDRPGLSLVQKTGDTPIPAPPPGPFALLPGMVGVQYGNGAAIVADDIFGLIGNWEYRVVNNGLVNSGLSLGASGATAGLVTGTNPALPTAGATTPHTYTFTVVYTSATPNLIIGSSETVTFTVTIWPQPEFITDPRLPDGMAGPEFPSTEPAEASDWYSTRIETTAPPAGTDWVMTIPAGTLDTIPLSFTYVPSGNYATIIGSPNYFATDRTFTFPATLLPTTATTDANPNFNITTITEDYTIKIWARYYLQVDIPNRSQPGYVYREGESIVPGQESLYEGRRAVMPGTQGIVRAELATIPFVRWEVEEDNFSLRSVQIGGPTTPTSTLANGVKQNGWWVDTLYAYARVTMPPVNNGTASTSNNVTIRGVLPTQMPDLRWSNSIGHVGDPTYSGSIMFTRPFGGNPPNRFDGDIGIYGPIDTGNVPRIQPQPQVGWEVSEGSPSSIPGVYAPAPGLNPTLPSGDVTVLTGLPTQAGTFQFRVAITLPGTMKIIMPSLTASPYPLTIRPALGLIVGDVDRSGAVNLADVIMLSKFLSDELSAAELEVFDADAANIRDSGVRPNRRDLELLVEWFTTPTVTSDFEYPISVNRPRNPDR